MTSTHLPLKISVVTVCYNAVDTIEETILSVINQTYDNVEYIIIDGGSTDGTVDIIRKYADGGSEALNHRHRITYWVSEPDRGIYDAMNKGIAAATGDYINFMNAGDSFYNITVLEKISLKNSDIVYGDAMYITKLSKFVYDTADADKLSYRMPFCHQAVFVKLEVLKENKFDISYRSSGDYELFYRLKKLGYVFKYIPQIICNFDATVGISKESYKLVLREDAKIRGLDGSLTWKLKYGITCLYILIRRKMKSQLPIPLKIKFQKLAERKYRK